MFTAIGICGVASLIHLFRTNPRVDRIPEAAAEIAVVFGLMGLVTGPLWGRKAWGVWWQWDAKLTIALLLEMTFISGSWSASTAAPVRTSSRRRSASSVSRSCRSSTRRSTSGGRFIR